MRRYLAAMFTALALVACGTAGPGTAGPLTLPTDTSTPSTIVSTSTPATSTVPPDTTVPPTTEPGTPTTTEPSSPATTAPESPTTITVYYLDASGQAIPTRRTVTTREVGSAAIAALIAGPTASERATGLATAFPADSLLLGLHIAAGTATVDMSAEFEAGGGSASILGRLAQLVYSLTEFSSVDRVQLRLDGQVRETFSGDGLAVGEPLTRADFTGSVPIGRSVASVPVWDAADLPVLDPQAPGTRFVVLVAGDDTLNVRATPGTDGKVMGELAPGVAVRSTDRTQKVGTSTWEQLETPAGLGWVNAFYLNRQTVGDPGDPVSLAKALAQSFADGEDFSHLISQKGLWVAHHSHAIRFPQSELDGLLASSETYRWGSNALEPDSPEIRARTFRKAIAERFADDVLGRDLQTARATIIEGPNGRPAAVAMPAEFKGFDFLMVFDPGDNPDYGGLDWSSWIVSITQEGADYKIVGLTIDEWSP